MTSLGAFADDPVAVEELREQYSVHVAQQARELLVAEFSERTSIAADEFSYRGSIAAGRISLAEPGVYLCPHPCTKEFYASFLKRRRLELTEKYQNLITRQMLREERWLEYTVALMQDVVDKEAEERDRIVSASLQDIPRLTLCHAQLQMVSAQGTEGTVIFVEEMEREVRFRVMVFDEIAAYEELVAAEEVHRRESQEREAARLEAERDARGRIEAEEWNARWVVEREEEKYFYETVSGAPADRNRIYEMFLWRLMVQESEDRHALTCSEKRSLCPGWRDKRAWSDDDDDEPAAAPDSIMEGTLAWYARRHEDLCGAAEAETRQQRAAREEMQNMAAVAFHMNHPVDDIQATQSPQDDEDEDDAVIVFGHKFTEAPPLRPAGRAPDFDAPPVEPSLDVPQSTARIEEGSGSGHLENDAKKKIEDINAGGSRESSRCGLSPANPSGIDEILSVSSCTREELAQRRDALKLMWETL